MRTNIRVALQYLEAWINGNGCVPIYGLMEDAATAEISRTSIWQWIRHGKSLSNGKVVTRIYSARCWPRSRRWSKPKWGRALAGRSLRRGERADGTDHLRRYADRFSDAARLRAALNYGPPGLANNKSMET